MSKRWYVVHAYSGMEKSVARACGARRAGGMQDSSADSAEEVVEMKNGVPSPSGSSSRLRASSRWR